MELCNDCDIAYDTKVCPLCRAKDEIAGLADEIVRLQDELSNSTNQE